MTTSVATFRNEFSEKVLNFVWGQWCRVGLAGSSPRMSRFVIDPEPLLAFTTEVARRDARMFDEVVDWLVTNGRWINAQRLTTIVEQDRIGASAVVGSIASWMSDRDKSMKWRGVARHMAAVGQKEPLFFSHSKGVAASDELREPHFERYGLLRGPIHTRGLTKSVNMKDPQNVIFRCRATFGIGVRADVMAYLVSTEGDYPRRIAEVLGYNHMRVSEVLAGMAEAGMATVHSAGRTKHYRVDPSQWRSVILPDVSATPQWVNWRPLTRGLTTIWRELWALDDARSDAYVFSSKMRKAMQEAKDDLQHSGINFAIEDDRNHVAEAYLPVFINTIEGVLKTLEGGPREGTSNAL